MGASQCTSAARRRVGTSLSASVRTLPSPPPLISFSERCSNSLQRGYGAGLRYMRVGARGAGSHNYQFASSLGWGKERNGLALHWSVRKRLRDPNAGSRLLSSFRSIHICVRDTSAVVVSSGSSRILFFDSHSLLSCLRSISPRGASVRQLW